MTFPMLDNILNQTKALQMVADFQYGPGRKSLMECATILQQSKRIVVSGMGASLFASIPLGYWLGEKVGAVSLVETSELLHYLLSGLNRETTVILVSRSGESVEMTKLLPKLRELGITVIGVVNEAESTLSRQADLVLALNSPVDELVAVQTYTGTLLVFAILAAAVGQQLDARLEDVKRLLQILPAYLESCLRTDLTPFLSRAAPIYFLGRGPSLSSIYESALLMHETAKEPAIGMSVAQFRHGPVEAVSPGFRAVVFGTQSKTRDLDRALALDLKRMGAQVQWVGPIWEEAETSGLTAVSVWPDSIAECLAPLLEVIPIQVLAYRAAEAKNIRPGQFRFATPITLSESGFESSALSSF